MGTSCFPYFSINIDWSMLVHTVVVAVCISTCFTQQTGPLSIPKEKHTASHQSMRRIIEEALLKTSPAGANQRLWFCRLQTLKGQEEEDKQRSGAGIFCGTRGECQFSQVKQTEIIKDPLKLNCLKRFTCVAGRQSEQTS